MKPRTVGRDDSPFVLVGEILTDRQRIFAARRIRDEQFEELTARMDLLVDERLQLMMDIPAPGLRRREIGVICGTWFSRSTAYEAEFEQRAGLHLARTGDVQPD